LAFRFRHSDLSLSLVSVEKEKDELESQATVLDQRFGIPGTARVVTGNGGLPKVVISTPEASGEMYLHGGHVTSWKPKHKSEVLYLSPNSLFEDGHAIRGGIPVCFPWFGDKADNSAAPAHGFVRTKEWRLDALEMNGTVVVVSMSTESDEDTRKWWPFDFRLVCRVSFGDELKVELTATNTGSAAFTFEEALHAYFAVRDSEDAQVRGLGGKQYLDKTDNFAEKRQVGDIRFSGETDRVYVDTTSPVELIDNAETPTTTVEKRNSHTTVVWNPWSEKSVALRDLGRGEWKNFVCTETTNVGQAAVALEPEQTHTMAMVVGCS
jgi:glucose-6-phosphate 1-epimerase